MKVFRIADRFRHHPWSGGAFGIAMFLAGLVVRFIVGDTLPPGFPYLTFFPAVILSTFIAGLPAGIVCSVLSGLAAWYWFIGDPHAFDLDGATFLALGFYAFIVTVDIALIHGMRVTVTRLREEQRVSARLHEQQRTMFQELQHRVANNMQFVAALLSLQKRKAGADPQAAVTAIDEALHRIETISRIHRRLYDPSTIDLPVGQYMRELCTDLLDASGARNVTCEIDMPPVQFDLTRLTTLSLLVVEVVTNALKHAFDGTEEGVIAISLRQSQTDSYILTIQDNGRGLPHGFDQTAGRSLGFRILQSLSAQLNGTITYANDNGAQVRLVFAAQARRA